MFNVFTTERLLIRKAYETDIEFVMELENDEDNKKYIFAESFEEHFSQIKSEDEMLLIIENALSKEKVGFILAKIDFNSNVFELRRIIISQKFNGYGTEAIKGLMDYVFTKRDINRFWLDVFSDNEIGISVYKKIGMTLDGTLREAHKIEDRYIDLHIFSMLKREYKK